MATVDRHTRQTMGCGYEPPPPPGVVVQAWDHVGREPGKDERGNDGRIALEMCPGYACGLPEVVEVSRARMHWSKGSLSTFVGGEPTDALTAAVEVLEVESGRAQDWALRNPVKER